jgi:starch synthase (maltosyl-transferring)
MRATSLPDAGLLSEPTEARGDGSPTDRPPPRVVVRDVAPAIVDGWQVKRIVGEPVVVEAAAFGDGHDRLWCAVEHLVPGATRPDVVEMELVEPGLDAWRATVVPRSLGVHLLTVRAWIDPVATWAAATRKKLAAGLDVTSELLEGAALLAEAAAHCGEGGAHRLLSRASADLGEGTADLLGTTTSTTGSAAWSDVVDAVHESLPPDAGVVGPTIEVLVEREMALSSSWYEIFPRSWSRAPGAHATFADVEAQLDTIAELGFDILYLTPIHPIGATQRKGRDNTRRVVPGDPGSPYAIGSSEGGHLAVHPRLGTVDDLRSLVRAAAAHGMETALDIALQCSPDHPWVTEHPSWFKHRPDGTIQYAENPPKKYEDIYPLDFDTADWRSLWAACLEVVLYWCEQGVHIFRVDNPHTKPFPFWAWLIGEVRALHPDVIFLSEAFSRPHIVRELAGLGFTQSYCYFPWRTTKAELTGYFTELSTAPSVDRMRPSCWPNTHDILPHHLMDAPLSAFAIRVFLAALLSPSYGIYGPAFEFGESRPAGNGKEEYASSEKYELRWRDVGTAPLRPLIGDLNRLRRQQDALRVLRTLRFHPVDNEALLAFSKTPHAGPSADPGRPAEASIVVVANLDPWHGQTATLHLDLDAVGVAPGRPFEVHDLLTDRRYQWYGGDQYVELQPSVQPGHIFLVAQR